MLRTTLEIDEALLTEAKTLTHKKTTKEVVNIALTELVKSKKRKEMLSLFGKVKYNGNLDEMRMH